MFKQLSCEALTQQHSTTVYKAVLLHQCAMASDKVCFWNAITVQQNQVGAFGRSYTQITNLSRRKSHVRMPNVLCDKPRRFAQHGDLVSMDLRRSIVCNNQFEATVGLVLKPLYNQCQRITAVVGGHNHRYQIKRRHFRID